MRYVWIYLVLSATDQAKAVRELTQNVRETTSDVSEQDVTVAKSLVRKTTVNRFSVIAIFLGIPSGSVCGGKGAVVQLL